MKTSRLCLALCVDELGSGSIGKIPSLRDMFSLLLMALCDGLNVVCAHFEIGAQNLGREPPRGHEVSYRHPWRRSSFGCLSLSSCSSLCHFLPSFITSDKFRHGVKWRIAIYIPESRQPVPWITSVYCGICMNKDLHTTMSMKLAEAGMTLHQLLVP